MAGSRAEQLLVQFAQRDARVRTEFFDEPPAHLLEVQQRVGGAAGLVQGEHELAGQAFVERVGLRLHGQRGQHRVLSAEAQHHVGAVERGGVLFGEQVGAEFAEPGRVDADERFAVPQAQRLVAASRGVPRSGWCGPARRVRGSGAGRSLSSSTLSR